MLELGPVRMWGLWKPGDASWTLGLYRADVLFFLCPVPGHSHLQVIRIHDGKPVIAWGGNKYKNIWQFKLMGNKLLEIGPSILLDGEFHAGIPTEFMLINGGLEVLESMPAGAIK